MACDEGCEKTGGGRSLKICRDPRVPGSACQKITAARVVASEDLLRGEQELLIVHEGQLYRLRRTRNNKLILHK